MLRNQIAKLINISTSFGHKLVEIAVLILNRLLILAQGMG